MNIAHIVPRSVKFPLEVHNGRYNWVLQLASLQAASGHHVSVYCHPLSHIEGVETLGVEEVNADKMINNLATFRLALRNDHAVYHSHFDDLHYEVANLTAKPIIYTQHWWPSDNVLRLAHSNAQNVWAVPPTRYMYEFDMTHGIKTKGFIYHGINLDLFRDISIPKNNRLLFVGRISPEKNLDLAIATAKKAGIGLDIVGKVAEKSRVYWENLQALVDGDQIRYLGEKDHHELTHYYAAASALLFPSDIHESFGLVAIEAQACGTPVIMKRGGSRGELIDEGVSGFLCETADEFVTAVRQAGTLKSSDCRHYAKNFDIDVMVKNYENLYEELVST